jgi:polysaccharide chain length determinant protein (PEP-CTERM system associated)
MNDGAIDLQRVVQLVQRHALGMWRYRWTALAVAWILSLVSWLAIYLLPDRYVASAQVFVDTDSVLRPLLKGLSVEKDVMNDVAVMTRTLLTRPHLERVARDADLDLDTRSPRDLDKVLASLERRIKIAATGANIYTITFEDNSRERAVDVVDKLLDSFVEDTLGSGQEDSQQAEKTLKSELGDYERRLTEAEDRLKEFKRQNVGLMPNEHGDYYTQFQAATTDLAAIQQAVHVANEKAASLSRQLDGEEPVFGIMSSSPGVSAGGVDGQIAMLEARRNELLVNFTEKHPEVVRIDQQLQDLRTKRDAQRAAGGQPDLPVVSNPLDINPVYQSLKIQRSKVEVELASLKAQLADKQATVDHLKKLVDVVPQVEAELNRLNRDYDVVKTRYAQMLQRWEDLQTGKRVKTGTDQVQFRIINPPFSPTAPDGPPRALFLCAAFIVSLGAGVGIALVLNLLRPVYHQSRDLLDFGLQILGSVTMSASAEAKARARKSNLALAGAAAALVVSLGFVVVLAGVGSHALRGLI